jgi:hypothetical protein
VAWEARATPDGNARAEDAMDESAAWNGKHERFHERETAPER